MRTETLLLDLSVVGGIRLFAGKSRGTENKFRRVLSLCQTVLRSCGPNNLAMQTL